MNIETIGFYKGYSYVVVAQTMGHRCGYIQIPAEHKDHGLSYMDGEWYDYDVHGGLTFDGNLFDDGRWYVGFDCAHCDDAKDPSIMSHRQLEWYLKSDFKMPGTIKTKAYVINECKQFIDQINPTTFSKHLKLRNQRR